MTELVVKVYTKTNVLSAFVSKVTSVKIIAQIKKQKTPK